MNMLNLHTPTEAPLALRSYQVEALNANAACYAQGTTRLLTPLPTGCGKTVIFSQVPTCFARLGRVLVIAHREELLDQAAAQMRRANPTLYIGIEQAERHASPFDDVVVASIQTLNSKGRLERISGTDGFGVVVVDEAHHSIADSYIRVLNWLGLAPDIDAHKAGMVEAGEVGRGRAKGGPTAKQLHQMLRDLYESYKPDPDKLLMGFTATPHRTDGLGLQYLFDEIAYSKTIEDMMREGWLCKIQGVKVDTGEDISGVKMQAGDYKVGELSVAVNTKERNDLAVQMWEAHTACTLTHDLPCRHKRPTIVFCVDVAHTEAMCQAFQDAGVRADYVIGATPKDDRRGVIDAYKAGELDVLCNCMVLTEGFDHAPTSCIVMARPTKSSLMYTQMLGRGTRLDEGKADLLVLDLVDIARAGVASVNTLFGLPPKLVLDKDVLEMLDEVEEILADMPVGQGVLDLAMTLEDVRQMSAEFNPLQQAAMPEELDRELELSWVCTSFGYTLSAGGISVGVVEDMLGHCEIEVRGSTVKRLPGSYNQALDALQVAEQWVLNTVPDSYEFSSKRARWRVAGAKQPASTKQLWHLSRAKVKYPKGISKSDASVLLSRIFAQKGRS